MRHYYAKQTLTNKADDECVFHVNFVWFWRPLVRCMIIKKLENQVSIDVRFQLEVINVRIPDIFLQIWDKNEINLIFLSSNVNLFRGLACVAFSPIVNRSCGRRHRCDAVFLPVFPHCLLSPPRPSPPHSPPHPLLSANVEEGGRGRRTNKDIARGGEKEEIARGG